MTVVLISGPSGVIDDLPPGTTLKTTQAGRPVAGSPVSASADVVVAFFTECEMLQDSIAGLAEMIFPAGGLWIAWPKKSSKVPTDLTDEAIREVVLPLGLVDNKVCAIDATWSGLRFVWRLQNRGRPR